MNTHPVDQYLRTLTRRQLFQRVGLGVGGFALANLLNNDLSAAPQNPFSHFAPKAKNVIYFHLVGAPSRLDLFDYKPELQKRNGALRSKFKHVCDRIFLSGFYRGVPAKGVTILTHKHLDPQLDARGLHHFGIGRYKGSNIQL